MQFNRDDATARCTRCRSRASTPAWASSAWRRCCSTCTRNYEIDLFENLIKAAARRDRRARTSRTTRCKVIADHIRACAFLIVDGVIPGNEGRGYVLRRIMRRAIRHGYKLGQKQPFFHKLVAGLASEMGDAYPELRARASSASTRRAEAGRGALLPRRWRTAWRSSRRALQPARTRRCCDGETVFKLHDTYGFPLDLTADICRERGVTVDDAGFDAAMDSSSASRRAPPASSRCDRALEYARRARPRSTATSSWTRRPRSSRCITDGAAGAAAEAGRRRRGRARHARRSMPRAAARSATAACSVDASRVHVSRSSDTQKIQADVFGHHGTLEAGTLSVGDAVEAQVDAARARAHVRNHSATHLMHTALRKVLGDARAAEGLAGRRRSARASTSRTTSR